MSRMCYNGIMSDESHNTGIMKYLIDDKDAEKFFHSSGYARDAHHSHIGLQRRTADTFDTRQELENNRQFVRGYKDSKVINDVQLSRAIGNAQKSQQISASNTTQKRGALGESVNGLRRSERSGFGMNNNRSNISGTGGRNPGGTQPSGQGNTPSRPTTPPARRVSGISR